MTKFSLSLNFSRFLKFILICHSLKTEKRRCCGDVHYFLKAFWSSRKKPIQPNKQTNRYINKFYDFSCCVVCQQTLRIHTYFISKKCEKFKCKKTVIHAFDLILFTLILASLINICHVIHAQSY